MSGAAKGAFRNVPPPSHKDGSKLSGKDGTKAAGKSGSSYSRFIPREELGDVETWKPGAFGERRTHPRPEAPHEATPEALKAHFDDQRQAIRQAGYQDGYRDGLAALESFKQHFAQQATQQIGALLDGFEAQSRDLDARLADHLARCAVQLARQVVRSELAQRPELIAQVATEAVNAVMLSARHISVHVHPADLPLVAEGADEALRSRGARLLPDDKLDRGGVRIESDAGAVDARIATRWAHAAAALLGEQADDEPWSGSE